MIFGAFMIGVILSALLAGRKSERRAAVEMVPQFQLDETRVVRGLEAVRVPKSGLINRLEFGEFKIEHPLDPPRGTDEGRDRRAFRSTRTIHPKGDRLMKRDRDHNLAWALVGAASLWFVLAFTAFNVVILCHEWRYDRGMESRR